MIKKRVVATTLFLLFTFTFCLGLAMSATAGDPPDVKGMPICCVIPGGPGCTDGQGTQLGIFCKYNADSCEIISQCH